MIAVLFAAAALFAQAQSGAQNAAGVAPPAASATVTPAVVNGAAKPSDADMDKVVCHSEHVLGTMFPKKTCASRREMADRADRDQQATRDMTAMRPYKDSSH
jgi:hypothetical protein